jgi:lipopolysaccharide transport system permease protein
MAHKGIIPSPGEAEFATPIDRNPTVLIESRNGLFDLNLEEIWRYRELLYFLVWRDVKVRYKQTVIGAAWVILQPVLAIIVFTAVFAYFAKIPSDGLPYPVFALAGLLPWNYFSRAMDRSVASLVDGGHLITKIYFPRLIAPLTAIMSPLVDFGIVFILLVIMLVWYGIVPSWGILALPLFLLLAMLTALAIGLWVGALYVRYRDVGHAVPFLTQIWLYASPVIYPTSLIPEKWRLIYSLNPMVGIIEGFRWGLLGGAPPDFRIMLVSTFVVGVLLFSGIVFFKRMEKTFADFI